MTDGRSRAYFERRAQQEQVAAQEAASEPAAQRHRELAEQYRRLVLAGRAGGERTNARSDGALPKELRPIS